MGDLSPHFSKDEFECHCCGKYLRCDALIFLLEAVRERFMRPVFINSGTRCEAHNERVGGEIKSQHLLGRAADIVVDGVPADIVQSYCNGLIGERGGMGCYKDFTHVDVRGSMARWRDTE